MTHPVETKLEHRLTNTHKAAMISYLKSHPEDFAETIRLALADKQPYSWRAAWVLWGCIDQNDKRLRRYIKKIIDILPGRKDNQQRELLMILQRMGLTPDGEARLFDFCTKTWKQTGKNPSLRFNAFKILVSISKKHPDLAHEVRSLTDSRYTISLSDSVKKSISKLMKAMD